METIKDGSITEQKDGYIEESMLFTYSEEEKQENEINRANAKLVFSPKSIPYYPMIVEKYGLTDKEALIFGFIDFYLGFPREGDEKARFYFTNEQIASVVMCSSDTVSRAISSLTDKGLILSKRKVRAGGGQVRFVEIPKYDLTKTTSQTRQILQTNNNKINKNKNNNIYDQKFEEFWSLYPRKIGKKKAGKIFNSLKEKDKVLEGVKKYSAFWKQEGTEPQYIPHPTTWLNQARWEDEINLSKKEGWR